MAMMKGLSAANPDAYVDALTGWQRDCVAKLRAAINGAGDFDEGIKWTNLLFKAQGPCIVIRAEEARVIVAFFRGKHLAHMVPQLKPSGKYELANLILTEATPIDTLLIGNLAAQAHRLNAELGDPTARHR